ncbi:hypothetical protein [Pseudonocardia sp. NPDC049635]|uniref:hypothetical protein n=1 Tax=Pseudonocardia sp. NPDC049635 TaxID=3155506 RepID=UPI0033F1FECC
MSESSNQHADISWPHPASEHARRGGHYAPADGVSDRPVGDHDPRPAGDRSARTTSHA